MINTHISAIEPEFTVFMFVKTTPEWLGFSVERRNELAQQGLKPVLAKHSAGVRMRFFDIEFYSARVTDLWMFDCKDHQSYQLLVEELREGPFWDRYFQIVDILPGVEDAYVKNYPGQEKITV